MALPLNNKIALVTGAGRGIGKAIAFKLASQGAHVICISKSSTCQEVANELTQLGLKAEAYSLDVSNSKEVQDCCTQLIEKYGTIDILVNNAGITRDNLLVRMSDDDWNTVISTNLSSAFYWSKHLCRAMASKRWGRVINISSVIGLMGNAGQFNYAAAKAGLIGATKSLAKEFASRNITANVVAPGFIETDMTSTLDEKTSAAIKQLIPMKRMGTSNDIANIVAFLASDEANYITGQVFTIDGGMVM